MYNILYITLLNFTLNDGRSRLLCHSYEVSPSIETTWFDLIKFSTQSLWSGSNGSWLHQSLGMQCSRPPRAAPWESEICNYTVPTTRLRHDATYFFLKKSRYIFLFKEVQRPVDVYHHTG